MDFFYSYFVARRILKNFWPRPFSIGGINSAKEQAGKKEGGLGKEFLPARRNFRRSSCRAYGAAVGQSRSK